MEPQAHLLEGARDLLEERGELAHAAPGESREEDDEAREDGGGENPQAGRGQDLGHAPRQPLPVDQAEGAAQEGVGEEADDERDREVIVEEEEQARRHQEVGGLLGRAQRGRAQGRLL